MKTVNVWILRDAKSEKYWLTNCVVFDTEKLLKRWVKKWSVISGQVSLDSTFKYNIK